MSDTPIMPDAGVQGDAGALYVPHPPTVRADDIYPDAGIARTYMQRVTAGERR
jgi:hypothetical protein